MTRPPASPVPPAQRHFPLDPASAYRVAATAADAGILVQDMDGTILWANRAYGRMMGYDPVELVGRNPLTFALPPEDTPSAEEIAAFRYERPPDGRPWIEVFRNVRSDGTIFWIEINVSFDHVRDYGEVAILVARDISDHVARRQKLQSTTKKLHRLATIDSLTGLSNRFDLVQAIDEAMETAPLRGQRVGLLNLDVDRFKKVNDNYGHVAGDAVLCHIADCLRRTMPIGAVAARIGGDEFVLLCPEIESEEEIRNLANRIIDATNEPVDYGTIQIRSTLSIGAAIAPASGLRTETVLKRADFALSIAKERGRGQLAIYDRTLHERKQSEDILADELRGAIAQDQLSFVFQPTMCLDDGRVCGFETLVRWQNPRVGLIGPNAFLPIARSTGLMADLDQAALNAALRMARDLRAAGHTDIVIAMNGSAELLSREDFTKQFFESLENFSISPAAIAIEVLETVVFDDLSLSNPLIQVVQTLHDKGVTVMLDDFGTGYAGLTHLAKLAISGVKIDRSLTENLMSSPTSAKIIAMMHELCVDLGIEVITEGIETAEQAAALRDLGGKIIQGYWLSRPMRPEAVIPWLEENANRIAEIPGSRIAAATHPRY